MLFIIPTTRPRLRSLVPPAIAAAAAILHFVSCSDSLIDIEQPPTDKAPPLSWQWQHPHPQGNDLNGVWFDPSGVGYAVGDAGTILRYDGASWELMANPVAGDLTSVWGYPGGIVTAVGSGGALLSLNGDRWARENQQTVLRYTDVWGTDSANIYAVSDWGYIVRRDDGRWRNHAMLYNRHFTALWGWSEDELWAFTDDGEIAHRDSSGWTLTEFEAGVRFTDAWGSASDTIYATCSEGGSTGLRLIRYDGASWDYVAHPGSGLPGDMGPMTSVWGHVYAASDDGLVHYDGVDWHWYSRSSENTTNAICGEGPDRLVLVGDHGSITYFDGSSFQSEVAPDGDIIFDLWGSGPDDVYAAGERLLHYDGEVWEYVDVPERSFKDVSGRAHDDVIAVGRRDDCLRFDGTAWTRIQIGDDTNYSAVWMAELSEDVFAGSMEGSIYRFDGASWAKIASLKTSAVTDIWGSSAGNVWVVGGDNGTIVHYDGSEWRSFGDDFEARSIWGTGPNDVYAAGDAPLWHYNGTSWSRVKLDNVYPLNGVWCAPAGEVFAAGPNGRTLYYDGARWLWLRRVTGNPLYGVWGTSAADVFACGFNAILHLDADQGSSR
jgi:hypothetical protein